MDIYNHITSEYECVAKCLEVYDCRAVTLVGPNPGQYEGIEGCYLKNEHYGTTFDTAYTANMASYDIQCVKSNLNGKFEL